LEWYIFQALLLCFLLQRKVNPFGLNIQIKDALKSAIGQKKKNRPKQYQPIFLFDTSV
jgi:hypothetical protein